MAPLMLLKPKSWMNLLPLRKSLPSSELMNGFTSEWAGFGEEERRVFIQDPKEEYYRLDAWEKEEGLVKWNLEQDAGKPC